jgi:hypothetical protein
MNKKTIITQSNYIPWKGFFDSMAQVDTIVMYDDMQYTKRDWRNRNVIKTPQGLKWLSIPVEVKGKFFQKINETKISDSNWNIDHLNQLKQNYKTAKSYKEVIDWIENLYIKCQFEYLSEINCYFIENINEFLGISVEIIGSDRFILAEDKTERLVNICKELGTTDYYSGPAGKVYMEESKFEKENIQVNYFDYTGYDEYDQLYGEFNHGVTIFDLIFNCGIESKKYLKFIK